MNITLVFSRNRDYLISRSMGGFSNGITYLYPFYVQLCASGLTLLAVDVACIHITFYLIYPFETGSSSLESKRTHENGSFFM